MCQKPKDLFINTSIFKKGFVFSCLLICAILSYAQIATIQKPIDGNVYTSGSTGFYVSSTNKVYFRANSTGFNGSFQAYHRVSINGKFIKQITDYPNGFVADSIEIEPGENRFSLTVQSTNCFSNSCIVNASNAPTIIYVKRLEYANFSIQNSGVGAVKIKWTKYNNTGTSGFHYRVYRNTMNDPTTAIAISPWLVDNQYIDLPTVANTNYFYFIGISTDNIGTNATQLSPPRSVLINTINPSLNVSTPSNYEYWFDEDYSNKISGTMQSSNFNNQIDVSSLMEGLHAAHFRFKDVFGNWSAVHSQYFLKQKNATNLIERITNYEYWFDEDYSSKTSIILNNPTEIFQINNTNDASSLIDGLHSIHWRFKDTKGIWSVVQSHYFIKQNSHATRIDSGRYWFNNDQLTYPINVNSNKVLDWQSVINIPSSISSGLNRIHFQFKQTNNKWSVPYTDTFALVNLTPTITLLTPDSGIYNIGDTLTIKFTSTNQHHYGLYLWEDTLIELGTLFHDSNLNIDTSFIWVVPDSIRFDTISPYYTISGSNYRIKAVVWPSNISGILKAYDFSNLQIELYKIRKINGVRMRELKRLNGAIRQGFRRINKTLH